LSNST